MIDFRTLSLFLTTCENKNLVDAAAHLRLAPSTLSARLKLIEQDLGIALFQRQGAGKTPRDATTWLYQASVLLLLIEAFAARIAKMAPDQPTQLLNVDIDLRFAFGRVSRSLNHALIRTACEEPSLLVIPTWRDQEDQGRVQPPIGADAFEAVAELQLGTTFDPKAESTVSIMEEEWVLVGRQTGGPLLQRALDSAGVLLPALPRGLSEGAAVLLAERGILQLRFVETPPSDWKRLLLKNPEAVVVLPASAVSVRSTVLGLSTAAFDPPMHSSLVGDHGGNAIAVRFLERLRQALQSTELGPAFTPLLTARRMRYFNLAYKHGRVSAAARAAHVTQPALSQQLHRLEETLGVTLFERHADGLRPLPNAARFAAYSNMLEKQLQDLRSAGRSKDQQLTFGLAPCFARGRFAEAIAASLVHLREKHGVDSVVVEQGTGLYLSELLHQGSIGLALVDAPHKKYPHLRLNWAEPLTLISHPDHPLDDGDPERVIDLYELEGIPLVLPTSDSGVRQELESRLRKESVRVRALYETDSFALTMQLLNQQRLFTVSTPGTADALGGSWLTRRIADPPIRVRARILYSASRALSEVERAFVESLSHHVQPQSNANG